jgi:hypothetical protein
MYQSSLNFNDIFRFKRELNLNRLVKAMLAEALGFGGI